MPAETITMTTTHDRNDTTATIRSIRKRTTTHTTINLTILHRTMRARTPVTAPSQITTGKTSRTAGPC